MFLGRLYIEHRTWLSLPHPTPLIPTLNPPQPPELWGWLALPFLCSVIHDGCMSHDSPSFRVQSWRCPQHFMVFFLKCFVLFLLCLLPSKPLLLETWTSQTPRECSSLPICAVLLKESQLILLFTCPWRTSSTRPPSVVSYVTSVRPLPFKLSLSRLTPDTGSDLSGQTLRSPCPTRIVIDLGLDVSPA